jgi:hypothetical protein
MQAIRKSLFSFFAILVFTATAYASCPTITQMSGTPPANTAWYKYDVDSSCLATDGNVSATSMACSYFFSYSGYSLGPGWTNDTTWTFTVPSDATVLSTWDFWTFVTFSSPTSSFYDNITGTVGVSHNGSVRYYSWFAVYGNQSSSLDCSRKDINLTSDDIHAGDTVSLTISVTRLDSNAVTIAAVPQGANE